MTRDTWQQSLQALLSDVETDISMALRALSDRRRRAVVASLGDASGLQTLDDVAAAVTTHEADTTEADTAEIATTLHHIHLPKLTEADLIEYDPQQKTVYLTDTGADIARHLDPKMA